MDDVSMDEGRATAAEAPNARSDLVCGECGALMTLRKSPETGLFYGCSRYPACNLTHSALSDGRPKGIPGSRRDADARKRVYEPFSRIWEIGHFSRERAYSWMSAVVGIPNANIGMLNADQCETLLARIQEAFPDTKNLWERLREKDPYAGAEDDEDTEEPPAPKRARRPPLFEDVRCKCSGCGRWMKSGKPTKKTPATRRPGPHAARCLDCLPGGCMHFGPCNQPDGKKGIRSGVWSSTRYVGSKAYPPDVLPPEGAALTYLPDIVMPDDNLATFLAVRAPRRRDA